MNTDKEISLKDIKFIFKDWVAYMLSRWKVFFAMAVVCGILGVLYASFEKPLYTAEITFTTENESRGSLGAYAGLAAQFGFDLGATSSSAFEGDNLIYLLRSRNLIEKTLFTPVKINGGSKLLINYYAGVKDLKSNLAKKGLDNLIPFLSDHSSSNRVRDSVLQVIFANIGKTLDVQKPDKKVDIISVKIIDENELFAKVFVQELVNNVIQYYTDYKVKKVRQNVIVLQKQTDSVRNLINGNIADIAVSSDLNINPTRQVVRTGIQRKQIDAQVNGALYTELVKNLELSKLALQKETPLIQVIDSPMLPLQKKKMGRLFTGILSAFMACFFTFCYYTTKRAFS